MAYADATDIADRLGRDLDDSETRIVNARLEDVELLILQRIPDLDQQVTDNKINPRIITMIEADAMLRLIRNPDGYTAETDGNYSYQIDARVASGRLALDAREWSLLGLHSSVTIISPVIRLPKDRDRLPEVNPNYDFEGDLDTAVWN